jgi:hypothetical protein
VLGGERGYEGRDKERGGFCASWWMETRQGYRREDLSGGVKK